MKLKLLVAIVAIGIVPLIFIKCGQNSFYKIQPPGNILTVQMKPNKKPFMQAYSKIIKDGENGVEKTCLCRALGFRIAQVISRNWNDGILRSYEIVSIATGWNTPGIREVLAEIMGVENILIPVDTTARTRLTLDDNWFIVSFTDGKKMEIRGTDELYTKRYMRLRAALERGEKDLYITEAMEEREEMEKRFQNLPLDDMFTVKIVQ